MPLAVCPNLECNYHISVPSNFRDTIQCPQCRSIVRVTVRDSVIIDVRLRKVDLEIPSGLPPALEKLFYESIACLEAGSNSATVVLAGLFLEGLLIKAGIESDRLVRMIEKARDAGIVSTLGVQLATASRLYRNIGAHYSDDLVRLSYSDARLVLDMTRKLADDIIASGKLSNS